MQLYAERACHLQHRREARVAVGTECAVQAFAAETGVLGHLGHALGAGDVAERDVDAGRITKADIGAGVIGGPVGSVGVDAGGSHR